jgi:hypothetical protein
MYVVLIDGVQGDFSAKGQVVQTLEQAFAQIACHTGLSYAFEPQEHGWELVLTDVERPDQSPDPVYSTCIKPRDAQHDLMAQAVDGRIRGMSPSTSAISSGHGSCEPPRGHKSMSPELPRVEDELLPMTAAELEFDIQIQMAAMRARKESGAVKDNPHFAKRLVERLWLCGFRPYKRQNDPAQIQFNSAGPKRD